MLVFLIPIMFWLHDGSASNLDGNGFLVYCPCMGRFGNQADHLLGALAFSKSLNRTLILPPWVEYRYGESKSIQVPFDTYFKVENLAKYHNVITMDNFMIAIAPNVWPEKQRISFCYSKRFGELEDSCNAKSGNPFGPFWDTFGIDFTDSEFYGPLNYDAHNPVMMKKWILKYSPNQWPVLAFTGAPASFPVQNGNQILQKYMVWSEDIADRSKWFIKKNMSNGGFIGIHLRNGQDWVKACQHVSDSPMLFAAPQCVGYRNEKGPLTHSMCLPQKADIIRQLKKAIKRLDNIKFIFVASDSNHMIDDLNTALQYSDIKALNLKPSNPHLDLAILGQANYFIGNCVSSYSAFVKRERDIKGLPSGFWAFPARKKTRNEELQLKKAIKRLDNIKFIFVASDSNHMIDDLNTALQYSDIKALNLKPSNPHLDLAILGQANYFIGNCVSSYSAFVKRERDIKGLPSGFWAFPARKKTRNEEL